MLTAGPRWGGGKQFFCLCCSAWNSPTPRDGWSEYPCSIKASVVFDLKCNAKEMWLGGPRSSSQLSLKGICGQAGELQPGRSELKGAVGGSPRLEAKLWALSKRACRKEGGQMETHVSLMWVLPWTGEWEGHSAGEKEGATEGYFSLFSVIKTWRGGCCAQFWCGSTGSGGRHCGKHFPGTEEKTVCLPQSSIFDRQNEIKDGKIACSYFVDQELC